MAEPRRIVLSLPERIVRSDLDPDAFAILLRNLVENGLRHARSDTPVEVSLESDGTLIVANHGPVLSAEDLGRLSQRFERGHAETEGSGLGLAIVAASAERTEGTSEYLSLRPGMNDGFEARFQLPVEASVRPA